MAARLAGLHEQALNHFVTNSPWDAAAVRRRLAVRMDAAIGPQAWAVDDTGWLKYGAASVCVARQYTGTAGKVTNCQIGVGLNLVTDTASCPRGGGGEGPGGGRWGAAWGCGPRQYTGTAGKVTNCQIGVGLNLVTDTASCPVNWRLFVPEAWDPTGVDSQVIDRRRTAAM